MEAWSNKNYILTAKIKQLNKSLMDINEIMVISSILAEVVGNLQDLTVEDMTLATKEAKQIAR